MNRIEIKVSDPFYAALSAFAAEQEASVQDVVIRATKALLSKNHRWDCGTRGRPFARTRKGTHLEGRADGSGGSQNPPGAG